MIKIINHKKYFVEIDECYNKVINAYMSFAKKSNEKNRKNLLSSLKLLSKSIYKFRSSIKNIYFGKESIKGEDEVYRPKED